jgi:hypothetical protein
MNLIEYRVKTLIIEKIYKKGLSLPGAVERFFMISTPFCGVPTKITPLIYYKMAFCEIGLIKRVNKGSKSLS